MNRDDALKKIKKCLALARSGSADANVAATALRQAQALMREHCVSETDVSMIDVCEVSVRASCAAVNAWESRLADMVGDAFGCDNFAALTDGYSDAGNYFRRLSYVFVGVGAAPSVAGYAFEVLSRQCSKARLAHIAKQSKNCKAITKTARGDEFAKGFVVSVSRLVDRLAQPQQTSALLLAYMKAHHPNLESVTARDASRSRPQNHGHFAAGHREGEKAHLNRAMSGMPERALLS